MFGFGRALSVARRHLSYANVMATVAVFIALGGGAYAATVLPKNSVGRAQLRPNAVPAQELADDAVHTANIVPNAVTLNRLSAGVREHLRDAMARGPRGATGETAARGPAGADGPGARRIHFDVAAQATATPTTVLDIPGLRLVAECALAGGDVALALTATAAEDAELHANFTVDGGTDLTTSTGAQTGNGLSVLTGGTETLLGGPATSGGTGFFRVIATGVYVSAERTLILRLVDIVNADTGRCQIAGAAGAHHLARISASDPPGRWR